MKKGYLLIASGKEYVKQACLCAMSIKATQKIKNVSLATNDFVPRKYASLFDEIIEIPWVDMNFAATSYIAEQRWKAFHITPYEETVLLDTDMIFLSEVSHWWKYLSKQDICFTNNVFSYRNQKVTSDFYRKAFSENNLPSVYCAFHYFKQNDTCLKYYKTLENICKDFESYYKKYIVKSRPELSSMDINHALACLITDTNTNTCECLNFVHMKSKVQDIENISSNWSDSLPYYFTDDLKLKIGNYLQHGIFHYTENKFCNDVIAKYEKVVL